MYIHNTELGGQVTVPTLIDFVDEGHDLLLAVGSDVTEEMRDLAAELGVDVEPAGMIVRDHFHHDGIKGPSVIAAGKHIDTNAVFDKAVTAPIMYEGVGMSVAPESELVLRGLVAQPTAIVKGSAAAGEVLAGEDIVLIALVQARNNARAVVAGSLSLFSNAAFRSPVVTNDMQSYVCDNDRPLLTCCTVRWRPATRRFGCRSVAGALGNGACCGQAPCTTTWHPPASSSPSTGSTTTWWWSSASSSATGGHGPPTRMRIVGGRSRHTPNPQGGGRAGGAGHARPLCQTGTHPRRQGVTALVYSIPSSVLWYSAT